MSTDSAAAAVPLRRITCSPAEEYSLRPGAAEPIPDSLAALILSLKGTVEIGTKGIKVKREELGPDPIWYSHPDSRILNDLSAPAATWTYAINRLCPDTIHIFDAQGRYIESLPRQQMPAALDRAALAQATREKKRQIRRLGQRLEQLHGKSTHAQLEELQAQSAACYRVTQTLPVAGASCPSPSPERPAPESTPLPADRLAATELQHTQSRRQLAHTRATTLDHYDRTPVLTSPSPQPATFDPYDL